MKAQKSDFITLEWTQKGLRAREILKVQSTESYRTDTVVLGWVLAPTERRIPFPFPPHTIHRKAQISHIANLHTSKVLSLDVLYRVCSRQSMIPDTVQAAIGITVDNKRSRKSP